MISIESIFQGDHIELKILLQNRLISSRFNRKLSLQREEHLFIENNHDKRGQSDSLKDFGWLRWHEFDGPRSHDYCPSDLHRILLEQPRVNFLFTEGVIKSQPSDFINEIDD